MRFFSFLIISFLPFISIAQSSEVEVLEKDRDLLKQDIKVLQDSLLRLEERITLMKSQEVLKNLKEEPIIGMARKGAYLSDEPSVNGNILFKIKEDAPIQVLNYKDRFYEVCINNRCGFMAAVWVNENEEMLYLKKAALEKQEEEKLALASAEKKAKNEEMLKKYGREAYKKMQQGKVWIGMNEEQAIFTHGLPKKVNRSVGSWGVHEQWVYNGFNLYFENGKVTSWQD